MTDRNHQISCDLLGKIVDEVFDGAIEDASVIEQIYAAIKKHEDPAPANQMALIINWNISRFREMTRSTFCRTAPEIKIRQKRRPQGNRSQACRWDQVVCLSLRQSPEDQNPGENHTRFLRKYEDLSKAKTGKREFPTQAVGRLGTTPRNGQRPQQAVQAELPRSTAPNFHPAFCWKVRTSRRLQVNVVADQYRRQAKIPPPQNMGAPMQPPERLAGALVSSAHDLTAASVADRRLWQNLVDPDQQSNQGDRSHTSQNGVSEVVSVSPVLNIEQSPHSAQGEVSSTEKQSSGQRQVYDATNGRHENDHGAAQDDRDSQRGPTQQVCDFGSHSAPSLTLDNSTQTCGTQAAHVISLVDVERLARSIVTAACELGGPADPEAVNTISITTNDLEAVVHRHVTAALETSHEK